MKSYQIDIFGKEILIDLIIKKEKSDRDFEKVLNKERRKYYKNLNEEKRSKKNDI